MAVVSPVSDDEFADLYTRHRRQVYAFCLRWLRSREEAEDAVQTTFMYAWRGLRRGIVPVSESAWMLAITRNVCLSATDAGRRRAAEVARDPHVLEESVAVAPAHDADVASLSGALSELTEPQRRAIVMREWQGLSYKEIADELGLSQSAVETLLFRARQSLARKLKRVTGLAPWLKSLLGGAGAKIALGTTVAVVGAAAAGEAATHHSHATSRPRAHVARRVAPLREVAVPQARSTTTAHRAAAARQARLRPTVAIAPAPAAVARWSTSGASTSPPERVAQPTATGTPSAPMATSGPVGSAGDHANTVPNTVANTASTATDTAANTVKAVAGAATNTATNTVNAVAGTATDTATTAPNTITAAATDAAAVGTVTNAASTVGSAATTSVTTALPKKLTP